MASYSRVTQDLLSTSPFLEIALWMPYVPLSSRKAILTLCRTQTPYWKETSSRAWSRLRSELQVKLIDPTNHTTINLADLISEYPFESSVFSGFLSSILRSAPLHPLEAADVKIEAFEKEVAAALTVSHPRCFDWTAILHHDHVIRATTRFHPELPHNPHLHNQIYARLFGAITQMKEHLFVPDYSNKTIGMSLYGYVQDRLTKAY